MTYPRFLAQFERRFGKGAHYAKPVYRAVMAEGLSDITGLPEFVEQPLLAAAVRRALGSALPIIVDQVEQDGVTKLVLALADGCRVETVVIPMATHHTLCVSSQVGCRMGCRFCETGQMGWQRDLTAGEIVVQVYLVRHRLKIDVRNIVFMGMGEPLDNFDAVARAVAVLSDQRGLDIAPRHITVSTVGLVDGIAQLADLKLPGLKLAVSLNAPDDAIRATIMPVNRRYPMTLLKAALNRFPLGPKDAIFFEYVLIKNVNDASDHARRLAAWLTGLPAKLNLIPYNPRRHSPFAAPSAADVRRFHQALIEQHLFVRLRSEKGARIRAACGQLGRSGTMEMA